MKPVWIFAPSLTYVRNWAKAMGLDLTKHPNMRWCTSSQQAMGTQREGYYVIIDWPRDITEMINILEARGYEQLNSNINTWPIEVFA